MCIITEGQGIPGVIRPGQIGPVTRLSVVRLKGAGSGAHCADWAGGREAILQVVAAVVIEPDAEAS